MNPNLAAEARQPSLLRRSRSILVAAALVVTAGACNDDDAGEDPGLGAGATPPAESEIDQNQIEETGGGDDGDTAGATTDAGGRDDGTVTGSGAGDYITTADDDENGDDLDRGTGGSWRISIPLDDTDTAPEVDPALADDPLDPDYWLWDWWPARDRDGVPAEIDGWHVAIALAAPANVLPGQRHDIAEFRYLLSDDGGRTWSASRSLWDHADAEGSRQWAGSALYDDETQTLYSFYTAAGETGARFEPPTIDEIRAGETGTDTDDEGAAAYAGQEGISYEQRVALATARVIVDDDGPRFEDWAEHQILFEGDGELYAATADTEGGAGEIDAFRDPEYFRDPADGQEYLLFTATMPRARCDGDGVVGIARLTGSSEDLDNWELLPPLLDGHCVNNELERPHIVVRDDLYYLLFTTHDHTFDDHIDGPEGLFGFVADEMAGPYEALNGSSLVLANPPEAPFQAYSWMTLPNGVTTSFFQYWGLDDGVDLDYVGQQDPEFQIEQFGGTFAPSIEIIFDGNTTRLGDELAPGQLAP